MDDGQDSLGGKRKYKENPLTAKAENGSLRIKIVRKGEAALSGGLLSVGGSGSLDGYALTGVPRSPSNGTSATAQPVPSPPKPRANRKHVPIFYQRPNAFSISASSSTDENFSQTQSTSTSEYEPSTSAASTSTSSTTGRFARLDIAPGLPGSLQDPMPPTNPLFTRGMSETSGSLTDLLKTVLPTVPSLESTGSYEDYSNELETNGSESLTTSPNSLLNPAAALRQLASSSAAYASHTREPPLLPSMQLSQTLQRFQLPRQQSDHDNDYENERYHHDRDDHHNTNEVHSAPHSTESDHHQHEQHHDEEQDHESPSYRFDAMSALQNAVKIAVASTSPTTTQPPLGRWLHDNDDSELGPPPSAPPGLGIQHSLMGGGIEAQPVIPTINTVNFNWNRYHQEARARAGSIPVPTATREEDGETNSSAVH